MNDFKRWENLREIAERVLGVYVTLTPASDVLHVRVRRYGLETSFHIDNREIEDAKIDIVSLTILRGIRDVGGFDVLH